MSHEPRSWVIEIAFNDAVAKWLPFRLMLQSVAVLFSSVRTVCFKTVHELPTRGNPKALQLYYSSLSGGGDEREHEVSCQEVRQSAR